MAHVMNPAIEMALQAAERGNLFQDLPGAGKPLAFLRNPQDSVFDKLMKEANAKPLGVCLNQQLTQARGRLRTMTEPTERKEQMQLIADLDTRFHLELEAMQKYG
ncbi:MAG: hypothetical protein ACU0BK_04985 [Shimia sp.]|jgi:hypothetical protein|uniref:hypothetical protein n=1 Tax=Shimia sp. TaxID=1954381 RepID=UPI0040584F60